MVCLWVAEVDSVITAISLDIQRTTALPGRGVRGTLVRVLEGRAGMAVLFVAVPIIGGRIVQIRVLTRTRGLEEAKGLKLTLPEVR